MNLAKARCIVYNISIKIDILENTNITTSTVQCVSSL